MSSTQPCCVARPLQVRDYGPRTRFFPEPALSIDGLVDPSYRAGATPVYADRKRKYVRWFYFIFFRARREIIRN